MATISINSKFFTVMVIFSVSPEHQQEILNHCLEIAPVFADHPGFISQNVHRSLDGSQIVNYLQWRSRKHHEACMESQDMHESTQKLRDLLAQGKCTMDVQAYEVIFSQEA